VAEYVCSTLGFLVVEVDVDGLTVRVLFSGGQHTIGTDPLNEHSCGIIFFLSPSFATGQFSMFRQMELEVFPSPLRQMSPINKLYINNFIRMLILQFIFIVNY